MKISLCITVRNEELSIKRLLDSITLQTVQPHEVVIVDGGSTDETVFVISNFQFPISNTKIKIVTKRGNRSVGRNEAIRQATGDIIAITDAGCELNKNWLKEIIKPFADPKIDVVSGYYAGKAKNIFEKSLIPYVLVMPDRIDPLHFLPATRSMAMRKNVWKKLGGFPEQYHWNEDYVFAKQLERQHIPIAFAQSAIVYWYPRETIWDAWMMFYAFARGDAQAGIWRPKVFILLLRICLAIFLLFLGWWILLLVGVGIYLFWSIRKNYHYVQSPLAFFYLPLLQVIADSAVFTGTTVGVIEYLWKK